MSDVNNNEKSARTLRTIFGLIMIIVYVGMGILLLCGFFDWTKGDWGWLRWGGGSLLVVYGLWRAYRQFKGIDSNV